MSKPSGQAKQIAARGGDMGGDLTVVLGKVIEPPAPEPNIAELVARFQIDTEALIATIRKDHQRQLAEQERKVDGLADRFEATSGEFKALRQRIEEAAHQMNEGVKEALNAQKQAVVAAEKAANAAAVFDKLKASQPDFHRMVRELDLKISGAVDATTKAVEQLNGLSRRLDEFEIVATDYEETKGAVRGIDNIVKNLDAESKTRRRTEIRG